MTLEASQLDKYLCVCGRGFSRKKAADDHIQVYKDTESAWPHQIMKRKLKGRLYHLFLSYPWGSFFKVLGGWTLFQVIVHHYHIDLNIIEGALIGISIGLILS